MSLVADSPVNSSSSDDFAAFLDAELGANLAESSQDEEVEDDDFKDVEARDEEPEDEEASDKDPKDAETGDDNDVHNKRIKKCKVEALESIHEQGSTSYATLEQQTEATTNVDICTHPGSFGEMCILCGQRLDGESGVTFGYIHKGLRLGNDEIVRLRNTDMKNLLRHRKLYLVLDLDHTLLNSTLLAHLTPAEDYLKSQADSLQVVDVSKGSLFMLTYMHMMTKLRPFVHTFLKEASQMFEMYIYTMGDRPYALEMAKLLDPTSEYFSTRVISRDDGTQRHQKGLDVVLGQESAVLILDDTENAWAKHKDNLILMERYHFFASSCHQFGYNCKSLSELKSDESEPDGALASVLQVLKRVHNMFFDEFGDDVTGKDVRQVLKTIRKEVLKDCKIVFSRVFPIRFPAEHHHLWKMAEQLGATCLTEHDSTVTHVVSTDAGTEKSRWAVKENKFLVHPRWIEAANFLWQKQPEENFPVISQKQPEDNFPVILPKQPEESVPDKLPKDE
ncbi:RNA polymerase II C-terminal domain phosphatase-like 4 isoform X3 [Mangifera indica]|uniref:RNA polymerase II C-terminal domain phosphatase-like 4 isoform X3 n=1 Tax=Mangifera indica TaxID=29780 RepID=UPI001CFBB9BF|nr:RNA polymerase II C-terminal domain phosphatase-like 4 isoform X3 [Mangifera indica]